MKLTALTRHLLARFSRGPSHKAMGLQFAEERVNLVQFAADGAGQVRLHAAASVAYPESREALLARPAALKAWLRGVRAEHGFQGSRVVSCLPAAELRLFPVSCSVVAGQGFEQALAQVLRERLRDEINDAVVDFLPIRNDDGDTDQREALVAVAPRAKVMAHLDLLTAVGLAPVALEVGPAALARLVACVNTADVRTPFPHVLAINFGRRHSHVSVIWGRRLVLDREIAFAESMLVDKVAKVLELSPEMAQRLLLSKGLGAEGATPTGDFAQTLVEVLHTEITSLVAEINKTLVYTASRSRGRGIDQIYLLGSVGRYPGVDGLLQQLLAVPVTVLDPFSSFASSLPAQPRGQLGARAGMAVAAGLALRECSGHA